MEFILSKSFAIASGILLIIGCSLPFMPFMENTFNSLSVRQERTVKTTYVIGIPLLIGIVIPHLVTYIFG